MHRSRRKVLLIVLGLAAALAVSFLSGAVASRALPLALVPTSSAPAQTDGPDMSLIQDAWNIINKDYVDRGALQQQPLTYGAISGMVDALGDTGHSSFLTPEMVKQQRSFLRGQYAGIGVEIESVNGRITIVAPLDDSPALKAGLRAGEEIVKVNGDSVTGLPLEQVVERISGNPGTDVSLTIYDPDQRSTFSVTLKRANIKLTNVSWQAIPGTPFADLRIAAFSSGVTADVKAALKAIVTQEKGIVLDLRNNPGGELNGAIDVASQFLIKGNVLLEEDAQGHETADPVEPGGMATSIPLVVLVNEGTASAAEIVAGALQSAKRAPVVGETTVGTGTVLSGFDLPDGSQLLLAVREWLTPSGETIWHKGITPDVSVSLGPNVQPLAPAPLKDMTAQQVSGASDTQFLRALQELQRLIVSQSTSEASAVGAPAR